MVILRDYQMTALKRIKEAFMRGIRRAMLMMPTGAGKTRLAAEIVNGASGKKKRVVFTVPAISLIDQTVEMFYAEGIRDIGVIQADHHMTDWSKSIQIASVQTLMRRGLPEADVVIRDEAHKLFKFDVRWMAEPGWESRPFIGLSATPWTKGLGRYYQELIVGITTRELIDQGYLAPFRVFAPTHPDLSGVRTVAGDYHEGDLSEAMNKDVLTADIVSTWKARGRGRPTICFAVDRAHARVLQERFTAAGVPAGYMDCETPLSERHRVQHMFENGDIDVVCNVDVIGMGIDWPLIGCISYCRPTRSEIRFVQNIGRGLRKADGKSDLLVLDHSDTSLRLGFVTDIHHDALSNGRAAVNGGAHQPRLPKECPSCAFLKPRGALACPNCGFKPTPAQVAAEAAGDLSEFAGKPKKMKAEATMEQKARFFAELKAYGIQKGYKPGWASNKYREKFGVWPRFRDDVPPVEFPSSATMMWIKHSNIAWAKSRNNPANVAADKPHELVGKIKQAYEDEEVSAGDAHR